MKLTGHKTREVFSRYSITSGRDLRDAVERLLALDKRFGQRGPDSGRRRCQRSP
jgi:hypothetical protein